MGSSCVVLFLLLYWLCLALGTFLAVMAGFLVHHAAMAQCPPGRVVGLPPSSTFVAACIWEYCYQRRLQLCNDVIDAMASLMLDRRP